MPWHDITAATNLVEELARHPTSVVCDDRARVHMVDSLIGPTCVGVLDQSPGDGGA
jgi:hypothetical protein